MGGSSEGGPSSGSVDLTIVPATAAVEPSEALEGWSLVERVPSVSGGSAAGSGCSLPYVVLQLEAPTLIEGHFD